VLGVPRPTAIGAVWLSDGVDLAAAAISSPHSAGSSSAGADIVEAPFGRAGSRRRRQRRRRSHCQGSAHARRRRGERHRARLDLKGLPLGDASFRLQGGRARDRPELTLPVEIRNDIARLEIAGDRSAGAVALLDKRCGAARSASSPLDADTAQPSPRLHLLSDARTRPFADVRLADRGSPALAVTSHRAAWADDDPRRRGNVGGARDQLTALVETAACWCASPDRAWPPPTTISCR